MVRKYQSPVHSYLIISVCQLQEHDCKKNCAKASLHLCGLRIYLGELKPVTVKWQSWARRLRYGVSRLFRSETLILFAILALTTRLQARIFELNATQIKPINIVSLRDAAGFISVGPVIGDFDVRLCLQALPRASYYLPRRLSSAPNTSVRTSHSFFPLYPSINMLEDLQRHATRCASQLFGNVPSSCYWQCHPRAIGRPPHSR